MLGDSLTGHRAVKVMDENDHGILTDFAKELPLLDESKIDRSEIDEVLSKG